VGGARAMADDDGRTFALIEIGDLDAAGGEMLHGITPRRREAVIL
jgi:hypothetical protein